MRFTNTNEQGYSHGVKMLVYGKSGVGKTRLTRTMPRPCIISNERGLLSLRAENIPVIEVESLADLEKAYDLLAARNDIHSITFDSVSDIAETVLAYELFKNKDGRKAYGEMATEVVRVLRKFRDMQYKHVLMIAKEVFHRNDYTGVMMYYPAFPGKQLEQQVNYFFDEVFRLSAFVDPSGQQFTALQTFASAEAECKDRSGVLEPYEYPDIGNVIRKIMTS